MTLELQLYREKSQNKRFVFKIDSYLKGPKKKKIIFLMVYGIFSS